MGLVTKGSDLDLQLVDPKTGRFSKEGVNVLLRVICHDARKQSPLKLVKDNIDLRIPHLVFNYMGLNVDLVHSGQSPAKTELIRAYIASSPLVLPLLTIIKSWTKARGLVDASLGKLNSWSVVLLVIHYLHARHGLPVLQPSSPLAPGFADFVAAAGLNTEKHRGVEVRRVLVQAQKQKQTSGPAPKALAPAAPAAVGEVVEVEAEAEAEADMNVDAGDNIESSPVNTTSASTAPPLMPVTAAQAALLLPPAEAAVGRVIDLHIVKSAKGRSGTAVDADAASTDSTDVSFRVGPRSRKAFQSLSVEHRDAVLDSNSNPVSTAAAAAPLATASLAQLVTGFFAYYSAMDWAVFGISVRLGHLLWADELRMAKSKGGMQMPSTFCIEDPFDPDDNTARALSSASAKAFTQEATRAHTLLSDGSLGVWTHVTSPIADNEAGFMEFLNKSPVNMGKEERAVWMKSLAGFYKDHMAEIGWRSVDIARQKLVSVATQTAAATVAVNTAVAQAAAGVGGLSIAAGAQPSKKVVWGPGAGSKPLSGAWGNKVTGNGGAAGGNTGTPAWGQQKSAWKK
jgi:hypothetical protein